MTLLVVHSLATWNLCQIHLAGHATETCVASCVVVNRLLAHALLSVVLLKFYLKGCCQVVNIDAGASWK